MDRSAYTIGRLLTIHMLGLFPFTLIGYLGAISGLKPIQIGSYVIEGWKAGICCIVQLLTATFILGTFNWLVFKLGRLVRPLGRNTSPYAFKTLFLYYALVLVPLVFVNAILVTFHLAAFNFNNKPHYGIWAGLGDLILAPVIPLMLSALFWPLLNLGAFLEKRLA
jgi:hypothetical protein